MLYQTETASLRTRILDTLTHKPMIWSQWSVSRYHCFPNQRFPVFLSRWNMAIGIQKCWHAQWLLD
jgi:hypothetical protein